MEATVHRSRGRPRDADIDRRVLEAARDILVSEGFTGATIQAIARRAGVRSAAIYRRWPSRMHLFEEAIFPGLDAFDAPPTGDLRGDLMRFVEAYRTVHSQPAAMAAMPFLVSSYQSGADRRRLDERAWSSVRPQFRAILKAAPRTDVDPSVDPDEIYDLLVGALIFRAQVSSLGATERGADGIVDLICRAVRPLQPGVAGPRPGTRTRV